VNSRWLHLSHFVLLFTKFDTFQNKIANGTSPISKIFPDYSGNATDIDAAQEFFLDMFKGVAKDDRTVIQAHFINNLDAECIRNVIWTLQPALWKPQPCHAENLDV
jgi:guanine nucleotide-binding protein subunit alpha, other